MEEFDKLFPPDAGLKWAREQRTKAFAAKIEEFDGGTTTVFTSDARYACFEQERNSGRSMTAAQYARRYRA